MTPAEIIEVVRALRKMDASKVVLTGVLEVDFSPREKRKPITPRMHAEQREDEDVFADPVARQPKLTDTQREELLDKLLEEYVPGN